MLLTYGNVAETRRRVISQLTRIRSARPFKVLDIGGSTFGWSKPVIDMVCDIHADPNDLSAFRYDICQESSWVELKNYVSRHGKFDYVICTHTLEDIYNPYLTLKYIFDIAHQGILTMPSIYAELSHVESESWLGYSHHRWFFDWDFERNCMLLVPKLGLLQAMFPNGLGYVQNDLNEVIFEFSGRFGFATFMNNYLGPTTSHVLKQYKNLVEVRSRHLPILQPYKTFRQVATA